MLAPSFFGLYGAHGIKCVSRWGVNSREKIGGVARCTYFFMFCGLINSSYNFLLSFGHIEVYIVKEIIYHGCLFPFNRSCTIVKKNGHSPKSFFLAAGIIVPSIVMFVANVMMFLKVRLVT